VSLRYSFRSLIGILACGAAAGAAASALLWSLAWATGFRQAHPEVLWLLPLAGLGLGLLSFHLPDEVTMRDVQRSRGLIPRVPLRTAPLAYLGTVITHFFGGSAGRERSAVVMGAALSDRIARACGVTPETRRTLLSAALGAGFGAATGAPLAGAIFGFEYARLGRPKAGALAVSLATAFVAHAVARLLRTPHGDFATVGIPALSAGLVVRLGAAGLALGLATAAFTGLLHALERLHARFLRYPPLRPLVGGLLLVALYGLEGSGRFAGLGLESIAKALNAQSAPEEPFLKAVFTALTLASGFQGGEFIPLVFVGSTLGNVLAAFAGLPTAFLAALGFAAVYAGASRVPWACAVLSAELFGYAIFPYALVVCHLSHYVATKATSTDHD